MSETLAAAYEVKEQRGPVSCEVDLKPVMSRLSLSQKRNDLFKAANETNLQDFNANPFFGK